MPRCLRMERVTKLHLLNLPLGDISISPTLNRYSPGPQVGIRRYPPSSIPTRRALMWGYVRIPQKTASPG